MEIEEAREVRLQGRKGRGAMKGTDGRRVKGQGVKWMKTLRQGKVGWGG